MPEIGLYNWLSSDPPILWHSQAHQEDVGHYLSDERVYRLVMYLWHQSPDEIEAYHDKWRTLKPQHRLLHLVNDGPICQELQARGVPAVFVNHNCFLDETKFTIQQDSPNTYDAVYNARMSPFKRHALLAEVPTPLVIGGLISGGDSMEYFNQVRAALPRATFTHLDQPMVLLNSDEVSWHLNSGRVGVCLSAVEGAMFAAVEYMLCGLPVVSTPSLGGRDSWFDPRFTRIVEPTPAAVAAAVRELSALSIPPELIRNATIARMSEHRHRFTQAVQRIHTVEQTGRDFAREFYTHFRHKCGEWRANHEVLHHRRRS